jgi:hypothetical protein
MAFDDSQASSKTPPALLPVGRRADELSGSQQGYLRARPELRCFPASPAPAPAECLPVGASIEPSLVSSPVERLLSGRVICSGGVVAELQA